ncbi:peptidoglycan-binding protein [Streptomyces sp. NPDC001404]|uniref:peptidoglycan-binding protein n=1 Tax=Streptomyces sp. NPDC001404 TaxID=3364571 RepID=UPI0036857CD6
MTMLQRLASLLRRRTTPGPADITSFPGDRHFRPGNCDIYTVCLRAMLIARGGGYYYSVPLSEGWSLSDLQACAAFQRAQGWSRNRASGIPDTGTWHLLVSGYGLDIRHPHAYTPGFPGPDSFGPGKTNAWILLLRLRLIRHGYADDQRAFLNRDTTLRAARSWSEELRAACTRFQIAHGLRGADADGYPTEDTWKRLWTQPTG